MAEALIGEAVPRIRTWSDDKTMCADKSDHACYFCKPSYYPPMPTGHTLCACCGVLMWTGLDDPMNARMVVCAACDTDLRRG